MVLLRRRRRRRVAASFNDSSGGGVVKIGFAGFHDRVIGEYFTEELFTSLCSVFWAYTNALGIKTIGSSLH